MGKIVHCNKEPYDIYIGRPSIWGNPYTHHKDKETLAEFVVESREEAILKYREYILGNQELLDRLGELKGKTLGCWCIDSNDSFPIPYKCHGQVLVELLNQKILRDIFTKNR